MSKPQLFIGSTNPSKLEEFRLYIGSDVTILGPQDLKVTLTVPENDKSVMQNAQRKAIVWSRAQPHPTLCDDTGFFIRELNGKPGVSVKTFGGELPEDRTHEDWVTHLLKRTEGISTDCYFERAIVFAVAGTAVGTITDILHGSLSRQRPSKVSASYPLGDFFIPDGSDRVWSKLTVPEQRAYDSAIAQKLHDFISLHHNDLWQNNPEN